MAYNKDTDVEHPEKALLKKVDQFRCDIFSEDFATNMDDEDKLKIYREEYCYPTKATIPGVDSSLVADDSDCVYLCGNSLGLLTKRSKSHIERELDRWSKLGVFGHFHGHMAWAYCDEAIQDMMAEVVGARRDEVAIMNALTVNIHLLMISFYQPTADRHKILIEDHAFPSDHYAMESQIRLHGYDPKSSLLLVSPREGEHCIRTENILDVIEREGDSIAVVMLSGVQYYTGQLFDIKTITAAAKKKGCFVGWDLAHAVGNVPLTLHDWDMDFAAWCTYKYLSAGAGSIGGVFVHERHAHNEFPKLNGWWSHEMDTRFQMDNKMVLSRAPACYRISNPSMLNSAALEGSLQVITAASMTALRKKSLLLTGYLELLLMHYFPRDGATDKRPSVEVLTPSDPRQRGCQLSLSFSMDMNQVFDGLKKRGVVCDVRRPNVIRVAPKPIYNSFHDVFLFVKYLWDIINELDNTSH